MEEISPEAEVLHIHWLIKAVLSINVIDDGLRQRLLSALERDGITRNDEEEREHQSNCRPNYNEGLQQALNRISKHFTVV